MSSKQDQTKTSVVLKVMKRSRELLKYEGKTGEMRYFNVVGCTEDRSQLVRIYQIHKFSTIRVGYTYKFANCIQKGDTLWVVSSSTVGVAKMICVADDLVCPSLPEDEPATGSKRTLAMALGTTAKSMVEAKIVKVSPVKLTMNGTLPVRCLGIKDQSGLAKIALFENLAEQSYMPNTTVQISGVYSKTYNKKPQLAVSKQTQFQFISNDAVPVTVDDTDIDTFQLDGDFAVQDKDEQLVYTVDALYEVASYTACSGQTCRKKKLVEGVCPTCEGTEGNWTLRCKLSVVREGFSRDVTLFEGDLMKLFGQLPQEADEDLLFTMVDMLPVDFTAKFSGTSFYNITKQ